VLLVLTIPATDCRHLYTDSFPNEGEYDGNILDPFHLHGSPFGGFSRATKSRLASLPLYLPDISEEALTTENAMYFEVRDEQGRPFACRVYNEDELEPDSLDESMFDAPRRRATSNDSDVTESALSKIDENPDTTLRETVLPSAKQHPALDDHAANTLPSDKYQAYPTSKLQNQGLCRRQTKRATSRAKLSAMESTVTVVLSIHPPTRP
jgi:hypothetical protein